MPGGWHETVSSTYSPKNAPLRMIWEDVTADSLTRRWQKGKPDGSWTDLWVLHYKRRTPAGSE